MGGEGLLPLRLKREIMNIKMSLVKRKANQNEIKKYGPNYFGWEKIDIVEFNFNGEGCALCVCYDENGEAYIEEFSGTCIDVDGVKREGDLYDLFYGVHYELYLPIKRKLIIEKVAV